jgi:hypothetical protein
MDYGALDIDGDDLWFSHGQLHNYLPIGTAGRERGGACAWMLELGIREGGKGSKG